MVIVSGPIMVVHSLRLEAFFLKIFHWKSEHEWTFHRWSIPYSCFLFRDTETCLKWAKFWSVLVPFTASWLADNNWSIFVIPELYTSGCQNVPACLMIRRKGIATNTEEQSIRQSIMTSCICQCIQYAIRIWVMQVFNQVKDHLSRQCITHHTTQLDNFLRAPNQAYECCAWCNASILIYHKT